MPGACVWDPFRTQMVGASTPSSVHTLRRRGTPTTSLGGRLPSSLPPPHTQEEALVRESGLLAFCPSQSTVSVVTCTDKVQRSALWYFATSGPGW